MLHCGHLLVENSNVLLNTID